MPLIETSIQILNLNAPTKADLLGLDELKPPGFTADPQYYNGA